MAEPIPDNGAAVVDPNALAADKQIAARILAAYQRMLLWLFLTTIAVIAAIVVAAVLTMKAQGGAGYAPGIFPVVVLSGCLGSFFSALIRLYQFDDLPKALVSPVLQDLPKFYLFIYSLVPAVVGAIAAAVLYLVFASKLLTVSDLIPVFSCKIGADKCKEFTDLTSNFGPTSMEDYAKALIWGFIAGFAERLVPDTLQRFANAMETGDAVKTPDADNTDNDQAVVNDNVAPPAPAVGNGAAPADKTKGQPVG